LKISGFTFLRNARLNGYPFIESIQSLLPLVDEYVIAVGRSQDDTRAAISELGCEKIKVIDTEWNETQSDRGFVYGQQKMIAQYNCTGDWAFYLEGDEVLHENSLDNIYSQLRAELANEQVEAFYFDFLHFYGTPKQTGIAGYRQAPRIIRNTIRCIAPDGLFFVVLDKNKRGRYPRARATGEKIYHYGHCRSVTKMQNKINQVSKYWGAEAHPFVGYGNIDVKELRPFDGSHPAIMKRWLATEAELEFTQNDSYRPSKRDYRNRLRFWIEDRFDLEISKKHFSKI
jgi:glycosyltransferase involved in cell wall biosynthesis